MMPSFENPFASPFSQDTRERTAATSTAAAMLVGIIDYELQSVELGVDFHLYNVT